MFPVEDYLLSRGRAYADSYRPESFAPVGNMIRGPNALLVHPSIPVRTVPEFVAYLKANPGLPYGSSGVGQSPHLSGVWFTQLTGTEATHVPFRGSAPALTDLIGGRVQLMIDNLPAAQPFAEGNQIRPLAVSTATRWEPMKDIPTGRPFTSPIGTVRCG